MSIMPTTEQLQDEINSLFGALTRCAAERDRYREALEKIATDDYGDEAMVEIARQALEGEA